MNIVPIRAMVINPFIASGVAFWVSEVMDLERVGGAGDIWYRVIIPENISRRVRVVPISVETFENNFAKVG